MKFITHYAEYDSEEEAKLLDNISEHEIESKEIVLQYLKGGTDAGVRCSAVYDFVENASTGKTIHCYTDGEFEWDDSEIYHFENYNLKLDNEFIEKILRLDKAS